MHLAEGIRKHGFRKWYERELLQSHAHLALTFVCGIGVAASMELAFKSRGLSDGLPDWAAVALCASVGIWALRRYLYLLSHAEAVANQADCPHCKAYGRLTLVKGDAGGDRVRVGCRRCGHEWHIDA